MASPSRFAGGTPANAKKFLDVLLSNESFDRTALEGITNVRFTNGRCRCTFPVRGDKQNRYGTLHVSYMSPGPAGETVEVDATLTKLGANLAFMDVTITNEQGKVVAKGSHTKFLPGTDEPRRAKL